MENLTKTPAWQALAKHAHEVATLHLREMFAIDSTRFAKLSLAHNGLLLDFSKQRLTPATLELLQQLAEQANWQDWRARMQRGETINHTEQRAVGHHWLRAGSAAPAEVRSGLENLAAFCESIHGGAWRGYTGERISDVVHIGIGGSDLGPRMAVQALAASQHPDLRVHFVANLDGADLASQLSRLDPRRTLFIIASKTFTTQETMANATTARNWLLHAASDDSAVSRHFVAASSNREAAAAFGISPANVFPFADWVGGRFSLWSSIGLPVALAIGYRNFEQLLAGARDLDEHFFSAPAATNLPLTLALIGVWNRNFLGAHSHAVFPYSHSLRLLPAHLQQLEMESNGKRVDRDGQAIDYPTNPIVWGEAGTNGQHSFFQLLHQGSELVANDFIAVAQPDFPLPGHHSGLLANCLAQSAALAFGKTTEEARNSGIDDALVAYRSFPGNQPSSTLVLPALTPFTLGQLIALYEHKVFCQGVLWHLNSFDQWGVELGKQVAGRLLPLIRSENGEACPDVDDSTRGLIDHLRKLRH